MNTAVFSTLDRFWEAQPEDIRAKILAFAHLCGARVVDSASFSVSKSGGLRLLLKTRVTEDDGGAEATVDGASG